MPSRTGAVGFSIGSKGYIGTGGTYDGTDTYLTKDFWEYDPATDIWTRKADFGGAALWYGVGFSIDSKGYLGTGIDNAVGFTKDFWEYDPFANTWTQKADLEGIARSVAVGFSIGSKGYIGMGSNQNNKTLKDFWEYTPENICPAPTKLRVPKISDTCARLNWSVPNSSVTHIKISYRQLGTSVWIEERKKAAENAIIICGLTPNTTYEWKARNICSGGNTSWVQGPNFTTTSSATFSSIAAIDNDLKVQGNISVQIMPNPNKGSFTMQMHLPDKAASTTLSLYNNLGARVWQQNAGIMSGSVSRNVALENKLSAGVYVMMIQHGDTRMMQKVFVIK